MSEKAYANDDEKQELFDEMHKAQIAYYDLVNTGRRYLSNLTECSFDKLWNDKERTENAFYDYVKKKREPIRRGILSKIKDMFKGK